MVAAPGRALRGAARAAHRPAALACAASTWRWSRSGSPPPSTRCCSPSTLHRRHRRPADPAAAAARPHLGISPGHAYLPGDLRRVRAGRRLPRRAAGGAPAQRPAGRMFIAVRSNERAASARSASTSPGASCSRSGCRRSSPESAARCSATAGELTAAVFAAFTSLSLLAVVFVAGVGRIAGAVVAGIMLSGTGLFVTFLNLHLNIGSYQAIVAGPRAGADRRAEPGRHHRHLDRQGPRRRAVRSSRTARSASSAGAAPPRPANRGRRRGTTLPFRIKGSNLWNGSVFHLHRPLLRPPRERERVSPHRPIAPGTPEQA